MKKILCFGDSNTFGFDPVTYGRYDKSSRWSGILGEILPDDYKIIEEGMNNRTGFFKNPESLKESGGEYLPVCLEKNKDFDICILSLGTNDAQIIYPLDTTTVKNGLKKLISAVKKANPFAKIIIIPPVKITRDLLHSGFSELFDEDSIKKIQDVFPIFEKTAKNNKCLYFDLNTFVRPSKFDGIHYTKGSHRIIAEKLADFILQSS